MSYDLRDKVVLITGASGGIGRACAAEFHRAGSLVVATARSLDKLETLAEELGGDRVAAVRLDVTDAAERIKAIAEARSRFGRIDVLVNNAGWASFGSVLKMPLEHLEHMLSLNFVAPVAMIQAVLPEMIQRRSGQIINISSVVGTQAIPRMTVYSATKAALNALSTGLRMELRGRGVNVLSVAPSSTKTAFFESAATMDAKATRIAETQYTPERVARAVVRSSRRCRAETTLSAEGKTITMIRRISHRAADAIMYRVAKKAMPHVDWLGGSGNSVDIDVAIALDHLTLAAVAEGLGTCWIGAFDESEIKSVTLTAGLRCQAMPDATESPPQAAVPQESRPPMKWAASSS